MQKITTFLWFDTQAEDAAKFYVSLFKSSRITDVSHYTESVEAVAGKPAGSILTVKFVIDGQEFVALNGGPHVTFNQAVSLVVKCRTQKEIDRLWTALTSDGGEEGECGWLKDKFGLSWQIVPATLDKMITDKDKKKCDRVFQAIHKLKKLDIAKLKQAYEGSK